MSKKPNKVKKDKTPIVKTFFDIDIRIAGIAVLSLLTLSIFAISNIIGNINGNVVPVKTQALDCSGHGTNDDPQCVHENNPCGFSCTSNPKVIPTCCEDIRNTGDPSQCCFAARRVCTPDQCAAIQGPKQRCGQMWELGHCTGSLPTNTPPAAKPPPPSPTSSYIVPTDMIIYPTEPPYILPTESVVIPTKRTLYIPPTQIPLPRLTGSYLPDNFPTQIPSTTVPVPTPTSKPVLAELINNVEDFIQKTKATFLKFFSQVLP